jgi:hypothetical protein
VLELPGTLFYYPTCAAPLARDSLAGSSMPEEMFQSLGAPVIAGSAMEIFQSIGA